MGNTDSHSYDKIITDKEAPKEVKKVDDSGTIYIHQFLGQTMILKYPPHSSQPHVDETIDHIFEPHKPHKIAALKNYLTAHPDTVNELYCLRGKGNEKFAGTLLWLACKFYKSSSLEIVDMLLKCGANPNIVTNYECGPGSTPLSKLALWINDCDKVVEAMKLLLDEGASPSAASYDGVTALYNVTSLFKPNSDSMRALQLLLTSGAKPNIGLNPLKHLVNTNNTAAVKLLLDNNADPNKKISCGEDRYNSSLLYAVFLVGSGRVDIKMIELLLKYKADPNISQDDGTTVLMYAIYTDNVDLIRMLIDAGADSSIVDRSGKTACDYNRVRLSVPFDIFTQIDTLLHI
jgi:hypothetical protein